jgi:hypothetical protein
MPFVATRTVGIAGGAGLRFEAPVCLSYDDFRKTLPSSSLRHNENLAM